MNAVNRYLARQLPRALALMLTLTAVLGVSPTPAAEPLATLRITEAWIRWLPSNLPAGGYLTIENDGDQARVLIGASSTEYEQLQLHRSITQGGLSKMVPVARITIAPHSTLSFASQGYHLMLMKAHGGVSPGGHVPVTLQFADGQSLLVRFEVRPPSATSPEGSSTNPSSMPGMPGMQH